MVGSWGCHCWGVEDEIFAGTDTGAVVLASATAESALALAADTAVSGLVAEAAHLIVACRDGSLTWCAATRRRAPTPPAHARRPPRLLRPSSPPPLPPSSSILPLLPRFLLPSSPYPSPRRTHPVSRPSGRYARADYAPLFELRMPANVTALTPSSDYRKLLVSTADGGLHQARGRPRLHRRLRLRLRPPPAPERPSLYLPSPPRPVCTSAVHACTSQPPSTTLLG